MSLKEIDFTLIRFWVQIHGMELGMFTEQNARKPVNGIGSVLEIEKFQENNFPVRCFIQLHVEVDSSKPLLL